MQKLKENGHEIVIASGRHFPIITNIDKIKKYIDHYILINGQEIIKNGKVIYKNPYDKEELKTLLDAFDKNNIAYGCVSEEDVYVNMINEDVLYSYSLFGLDAPKVDKDYYLKKDIYQVWCFGKNEDVIKISKDFKKLKFISWGEYGFDVLKENSGKANAIDILASSLGFDLKDTIAIGDGLNDVDMIEKCGLGIAMGQASDVLKNKADYVTENIDENGLYNAFVHYNLI